MRIPKYRKNGDGRAFAVYPKSGGKREYFGQYGSVEAESKYKEWLTRLLNSEGLLLQEKQQCEYYVIELVVKYVEHLKTRVSPTRHKQIHNALKRLVKLCGSELAINIGPKTIIQYQQMMAKEEHTQFGKPLRYKRVTINKYSRIIKRFVKWCCKYEYLPPEHHLKLEAVGGLETGEYGVEDGEAVRPALYQTMKKTLPYFSSDTLRAMVQVQYYCGMRPGEVCNLRWSEIDQSQDIWIYTPNKHKMSHKNLLLSKAIPPVAQNIILSDDKFTQGEYLFPSGRTEKYRPGYYGTRVKEGSQAAVKAGVISEEWSPNQLRHAIATDIRRVCSRDKAQTYLGHSSIDTTGIYADRTIEEVIEIARRLQKELFDKDQ